MGGPSGRSGTGRGTLWKVQDGSGNLGEVREGVRFGRPSLKSGRDGGTSLRVYGPSRKSGIGQGTVREVWDGLEDPRGGLGLVKRPQGGPGRVGGRSRGSVMGWGNLEEVRKESGDSRGVLGLVKDHGEVQEGSRDPRGCLGRDRDSLGW